MNSHKTHITTCQEIKAAFFYQQSERTFIKFVSIITILTLQAKAR